MDVLDKAILRAVEKHSGATRKGGKIPYILHPMEAATIAGSLTCDREVLAAAVLHDTVEDTDYTEAELRAEFGDRVAALVLSDSENKREGLPPEETWQIRKEETLRFLENADRDEKIICLADKLSNMRTIARDYAAEGEAFWNRFHMKEKAKHAWYYRGVAERLAELSESAAYGEYLLLIEKVFGR